MKLTAAARRECERRDRCCGCEGPAHPDGCHGLGCSCPDCILVLRPQGADRPVIVWLAEHHVIYEGTTVLGIYSTKELAERAVDRHKTTISYHADSEWWVTKWYVDGHPLERAERA